MDEQLVDERPASEPDSADATAPSSNGDRPVTVAPPRRPSVITAIGTNSARRWPITAGVWGLVVLFGLVAYFGGLAREGFPPVNLPIVVVDGTYFVDSTDQVDADVAGPLGAAFQDVDGVKEVQSIALDNSYAVIVEFESEFSSPEGAAILEGVVPGVGVPPEASLVVRSIDATKFLEVYDVLVSVTGPDSATPEQLEAEADRLAEFLLADNAVTQADVRNLLTEGVNPETGETEIRQTEFTRVALEESGVYQEAIAIGLVRNPDAGLDILTFSDAVNDRLDEDPPLSDGYTAAVTADFATDIRSQISNLTGNLLTGLIAVAIVSFLLIGWRASVITAGFMATVMLSALAGLWVLGYSLNTITLFGLILTLGLLVDDAIVISESIDANRDAPPDKGDQPVGVIRQALDRVGSASFAGTLTTVLVFAPMLFVSGVLGEFIRAIPATVILTLLLSFLFSIVFIPAIAKSFLLRGGGGDHAVIKLEKAMGRGLGRVAEYPSSHGLKGVAAGFGLVAFGILMIFGSFNIAASLGFNIFPPGKDANGLTVEIDFPVGTTIDEAQELSREIDSIVVEVLGEDLLRSQYVNGDERGVFAFVDLVPFDTRDTTAPTYVDRLEARFAEFDDLRITVGTLENGPPVEEFPFAAQITVDADTVDAGNALALDLQAALIGAELDKASGEETTIEDSNVSTDGQVYRIDGQRQIEVRASYSNDDLTNNLDATEVLVNDLFPATDLESRGLSADAIAFDFGQESDNQEDFASLQQALLIALGLMLLLLVFQFRSIVQPFLIFLAIPFSFFGVFSALSLTDNPISFFVAVGFIALIGVVVNNTILLVDAANQGRRAGLRPGEAIGQAVTRRFRPLVATTLTTVVGLLPLALSDPFWEALSFTLIGGLISSTLLVLISFPMFYLAVEKVRTPVRNWGRRRLGWPEIV